MRLGQSIDGYDIASGGTIDRVHVGSDFDDNLDDTLDWCGDQRTDHHISPRHRPGDAPRRRDHRAGE